MVVKTHDLGQLLTILRSHHPSLRPFRRGLDFLTRFAVDTRYPGDYAIKREAVAALRWTGKVRMGGRSLLGLRTK
jgi:hypothetical protein